MLIIFSVALTTCLSLDIQTSSKNVLKFPDVKTFEGINNLSAFKTTGLFTCKQAGLYLISVTIVSHTPVTFSIHRNSSLVIRTCTYEKAGNSESDHGSTAVLAVVLNVGDTISVRTIGVLYIHSPYSCMTIIKIKWISFTLWKTDSTKTKEIWYELSNRVQITKIIAVICNRSAFNIEK